MKLGVFNPVLYSMSLEKSLEYLQSLKVDAMELGCGGYPGTVHADAKELRKNPKKLNELKGLFEKYGISISALSVHGNGVHPDKKIADSATEDFESACEIAEKLNVSHIVTFSGCPGDGHSKAPNWVTCSWPPDFAKLLEEQWNEVLIPYWKKEAKVAEDAKVKICFEMHPGFCVYNPSTLLRLHEVNPKVLGANFDPSHLIWQGIDPVEAIKHLGKALFYFHAKDTMFNYDRKAIKGVLDTDPYTNEISRSWLFRTVGYGACDFKGMITALRLIGYDHVLSIEHEDSLMTPKEGLEKAVAYLRSIMICDSSKNDAWWA